jgi:phosphoserine aminotransferase
MDEAPDYLGTSHRRDNVQWKVADLKGLLLELFVAPDGYEVMLGNGGATAFWDAALFSLIDRRSQHLSFGEFSEKFAKAVQAAPFLDKPSVIESEPGTHPLPVADPDVDVYAQTHNETSTGVAMMPVRPVGARDDQLVVVDATSAAGGLRVDLGETDVYYFAPEKCLASDGGLWLALVSPRAVERIERIAASGRYIPSFLNLKIALDNSRLEQTYNTPALATIFLAVEQIRWMTEQGGLNWAASRCDESARTIYDWATARDFAEPYVRDPSMRSHVNATIRLRGSVDALEVASVLRRHKILDVEPYRNIGSDHLRVGLFPAIDPDDVQRLCACVDYVVEHLYA